MGSRGNMQGSDQQHITLKNLIFAWADININNKVDQDLILYFLNFYSIFWEYISREWLLKHRIGRQREDKHF